MKSIDFRHFKVFKDISETQSVEYDASKELADLIYKNVNGLQALDLAMRIFKSSGPVELSAEDESILIPFVEKNFTPCFINSFKSNLKEA